jgi:hypothetical protein
MDEARETRCAGAVGISRDQTQTAKTKAKVMNDKFDELARNMAQSVTRRGALKKFGAGLAGLVVASLGFTSTAQADPKPKTRFHCLCGSTNYGCDPASPTFSACVSYCGGSTDKHACNGGGVFRFLRNLLDSKGQL